MEEQQEKKELQRIKVFKFREKEYQVEVPTVGQYIDIENQKIVTSNGHWLELLKSQTISAFRSIQLIECISILKVLCPSLLSDMKVDSYKDIDAIDFVELFTIYTNEINPWYSAWFEEFNKIIVDFNKKDKE